jgi:hypothetical protein
MTRTPLTDSHIRQPPIPGHGIAATVAAGAGAARPARQGRAA